VSDVLSGAIGLNRTAIVVLVLYLASKVFMAAVTRTEPRLGGTSKVDFGRQR